MVHRVRSDSVLACFLVPRSHKLGQWKLLRSAAEAELSINNPNEAFTHALAPLAAHTLFLVDFGAVDVVAVLRAGARSTRTAAAVEQARA